MTVICWVGWSAGLGGGGTGPQGRRTGAIRYSIVSALILNRIKLCQHLNDAKSAPKKSDFTMSDRGLLESRFSAQLVRNNLLARAASVSIFQLLSSYYLSPLLVLFALSLFIGSELAGVIASRAIERKATPAAKAGLLLAAFFGSIAFTIVPLALYEAGSVTANAVAVLALATAVLHCIIVRSTWLSFGLVTVLPMLAALLYIYLDVLRHVTERAEILIGLAILALVVLYIGRSVQEMNAVRISLLEAREEADAASRAKSRFLAAMSHEIRTPLHAICGITELLDADQDRTLLRERCKLLLKSARALNEILDEVLDHAKVDSGHWELTLRNACLADEIQSVVEMFRVPAEEKNLRITLSLAADLPPLSSFDPQKVRQVLANLLSNAVKYTERGTIMVNTFASALNDGWLVQITVADTGRGLTSDQIKVLFKDFSRIAVETDVQGAGLGLVISQELANLMGGDVTVESIPGEGSAFHFTARLQPPREPIVDEAPANLTDKHPKSPDTGRIRSVLIVDDNATSRYLAKAFLASHARRIDEAENGKEALALISERPYEVVLLDRHMPEMGGQETLATLRGMGGRFATMPVIMLTASASIEEQQDYLALGVSGCLCKPVSKDRLLAEIDSVMSGTIFSSRIRGARPDGVNAVVGDKP